MWEVRENPPGKSMDKAATKGCRQHPEKLNPSIIPPHIEDTVFRAELA